MKFLRALGIAVLTFAIVFTAMVGKRKITEGYSFSENQNYKGILTVWQVDSFEGGVGSRKQFLLKVARAFEKKNAGVLVMVIDRTAESVKESLEKGEYPDMISYGCGVEIYGFTELENKGVNKGGYIGEKVYATPWCRGGYTLIANPKFATEIPDRIDNLLVSCGEYNSPLTSLVLEGISVGQITIKTPMNAYVQFVSNNTPYFLGTQRDINRLERRGFEYVSKPLKEYSDLYQYISVTSTDNLKSYYSKKFVDFLTDKQTQQSLSEIGMFSVNYLVEYQNEQLQSMQNTSINHTVSAFIHKSELLELSKNSLLYLQGEKSAEIKIKNMLV